MGMMDFIVSRIGGINENGERIRVRSRPSNDRGGIHDVVETKDKATGEWKETADVPGSRRQWGSYPK